LSTYSTMWRGLLLEVFFSIFTSRVTTPP